MGFTLLLNTRTSDLGDVILGAFCFIQTKAS
jgi:hypothetical protein